MRSDESIQKAHGTIERWYMNMVKQYADDLIEEIKDGDIENEEALHDRLHEDSDNAVIYTFDAMNIVIASRYGDEYAEQGVELNFSDSIPWSQMAYFAFQRDLQERIGSFDDHAPEEDDDY